MRGQTWWRLAPITVVMGLLGWLTLNSSPASADDADPSPDQRIFLSTQARDARNTDLAGRLLARAQAQGQIRVIVGLALSTQPSDGLSPMQAQTQAQRLQSMQRGVASRVLGRASGDDIVLFEDIPFLSIWVDPAQLRRLLADPDVVSVEEDTPAAPADEDSNKQVHAADVWREGITGKGYAVAVLDTGVAGCVTGYKSCPVFQHPMLKGKIVAEACFSTNKVGSTTASSLCPGGAASSTAPDSGVNCSKTVDRTCFHGTFVASIAAGAPSPAITGLRGAAAGASLVAVQVASKLCNSSGKCRVGSYATDQVQALRYVYNHRNTYKVASVNISLASGSYAGPCDSARAQSAEATVIANLRAAGIATVIASGNNGYFGSVGTPGCVSSAITVAATTKGDAAALEYTWPQSNISSQVALMAPGVDIVSATLPNCNTAACMNAAYTSGSGTSDAAPHVAGGFALLKQANPSASVNDMLAALACTGKTVLTIRGSNVLATPRIDLLSAYQYLKNKPQVDRVWDFATEAHAFASALDWSPFWGSYSDWRPTSRAGTWVYSGRPYTGWSGTYPFTVMSATAGQNNALTPPPKIDCIGSSFTVTAVMRRVYGGGNNEQATANAAYAGIIVKARPNWSNGLIDGGYFFGYNYFSKSGTAAIFRMGSSQTAICTKSFTKAVNYNTWNTLEVASTGSSMVFKLNGTVVCRANDATYPSGAVMLYTEWPPVGPNWKKANFAFDVKSLKIGP